MADRDINADDEAVSLVLVSLPALEARSRGRRSQ